jgi:hypothetical protein
MTGRLYLAIWTFANRRGSIKMVVVLGLLSLAGVLAAANVGWIPW